MAASARENYYVKNTLLCLLKAVEGKVTTIDLRNENSVTGRVDNVDGYMNISMSNVLFRTYKGQMKNFESFFVQGVNVRFVHIPDEIDMRKSIEKYIHDERAAGDKVRRRIRQAAMEKMVKRQQRQLKEEKMEQKLKDEEENSKQSEENSREKESDKT